MAQSAAELLMAESVEQKALIGSPNQAEAVKGQHRAPRAALQRAGLRRRLWRHCDALRVAAFRRSRVILRSARLSRKGAPSCLFRADFRPNSAPACFPLRGRTSRATSQTNQSAFSSGLCKNKVVVLWGRFMKMETICVQKVTSSP
jgi:hypothetical protein